MHSAEVSLYAGVCILQTMKVMCKLKSKDSVELGSLYWPLGLIGLKHVFSLMLFHRLCFWIKANNLVFGKSFNWHRTFTLCGGSLNFKRFFTLAHHIYKNGSLKNHPLNGSLGNQNWFFYCITLKNYFGHLFFFKVYHNNNEKVTPFAQTSLQSI